MAKAAKSFNDKMNKSGGRDTKRVRVIRSVKRETTGGVSFLDNMIEVPQEGKVEEHVKKHLDAGA